MNRSLLFLTVLVIATCGLIYELIVGTLASYLLGDSITQFSTVIGVYLFRKDVKNYFISRGMTAADVQGWDSLRHIELIVAVETAFSVRFKTVEVSRLQTVGDLIDRLTVALNR